MLILDFRFFANGCVRVLRNAFLWQDSKRKDTSRCINYLQVYLTGSISLYLREKRKQYVNLLHTQLQKIHRISGKTLILGKDSGIYKQNQITQPIQKLHLTSAKLDHITTYVNH